VLTWIQDPLINRKKSVGNRVAIIEKETSSAISRYVPSQSNPAELISRSNELSKFPPFTLWWKGPHGSTQELLSWPTTDVNHFKHIQHHCKLKNIPQLQISMANREIIILSTEIVIAF